MKKFKIAIISVVVLVALCIGALVINYLSIDPIIKETRTMNKVNEFKDYEKVYNTLDKIFSKEDCKNFISKNYKNLGYDSSNEAYIELIAEYHASMIHTNRYDEFAKKIEITKDFSSDDLSNYYLSLWIYSIAFANDKKEIQSKDVIDCLNSLEYSSEQKLIKDIFIYYLSAFQKIEISDEFKQSIIESDIYTKSRTEYVCILLLSNHYDDFNDLFVAEYSNQPFDGVDIQLLIQSGLTNDQKGVLSKSLVQLKDVYHESNNTIKEKIIDNLLDYLQR